MERDRPKLGVGRVSLYTSALFLTGAFTIGQQRSYTHGKCDELSTQISDHLSDLNTKGISNRCNLVLRSLERMEEFRSECSEDDSTARILARLKLQKRECDCGQVIHDVSSQDASLACGAIASKIKAVLQRSSPFCIENFAAQIERFEEVCKESQIREFGPPRSQSL